ncbi:MAG: hypothetical protein R3Y63_06085 [Eubacteriales bacterium]
MKCHCDQCEGNGDEEESCPVQHCQRCHYDIYEGDLYIEVDDEKYCIHCVEQLSPRELLTLLKEPIWEAD